LARGPLESGRAQQMVQNEHKISSVDQLYCHFVTVLWAIAET
jgi:hypothetical protein